MQPSRKKNTSRRHGRRRRGRHETKIRTREAADVRQNDRQVGRTDAEPRSEGRAVFVDARRGNPAAAAGVVGAADGEAGHLAVDVAAFQRAADEDLVIAPYATMMALKSFGDAVSAAGAAATGTSEESSTKTRTTSAKPRKTATRRPRKAGDATYLDEVGNSDEQ